MKKRNTHFFLAMMLMTGLVACEFDYSSKEEPSENNLETQNLTKRDSATAEINKRFKAVRGRIDENIEMLETQIDSATMEQKEQLEFTISELKSERDLVLQKSEDFLSEAENKTEIVVEEVDKELDQTVNKVDSLYNSIIETNK